MNQSIGVVDKTRSANFKLDAAAIVGIEIRNEIREASSRVNPVSKAAVMVIPDLDVPGISARHWLAPIRSAFFQSRSASLGLCLPRRSAANSKIANTIVVMIIVLTDRRCCSMSKRNRKPIGRIGRLAIIRLVEKLLSLVFCPEAIRSMSALESLRISCRKYQITARREPK